MQATIQTTTEKSRGVMQPMLVDDAAWYTLFAGLALVVDFLLVLLMLSDRRLRDAKHEHFVINLIMTYIVMNCFVYIATVDKIDMRFYIAPGIAISVFALTILVGDRLMAMIFPYKYSELPKVSSFAIIVVSWLVPIAYGVVDVKVFDISSRTRYLICILTPLIGIPILFLPSLCITVAGNRQLKNMLTKVSTPSSNGSASSRGTVRTTPHETPSNGSLRKYKNSFVVRISSTKEFKKEVKLVYAVFVLVIIFTFTWVPLGIYCLAKLNEDPMYHIPFMKEMLVLNAIGTPLTYLGHSKKMKNILVHKCTCSNNRVGIKN